MTSTMTNIAAARRAQRDEERAQRDEERARSAERAELAKRRHKELLHAREVFKRLCTSSETLKSFDRFTRMEAFAFRDRAGNILAQQAKCEAERKAERVVSAKAFFARAEAISNCSRCERAGAMTRADAAEPDAGERRIQDGLAADAVTRADASAAAPNVATAEPDAGERRILAGLADDAATRA
jgi:hypothetical protein